MFGMHKESSAAAAPKVRPLLSWTTFAEWISSAAVGAIVSHTAASSAFDRILSLHAMRNKFP